MVRNYAGRFGYAAIDNLEMNMDEVKDVATKTMNVSGRKPNTVDLSLAAKNKNRKNNNNNNNNNNNSNNNDEDDDNDNGEGSHYNNDEGPIQRVDTFTDDENDVDVPNDDIYDVAGS